MALFSRKNTKKENAEAAGTSKVTKQSLPTDRDLASVIIKPRITEKAVAKSEQNVYTFTIRRDATKRDVAAAITAFYNVTPVKVNIVNKAPRQYMSRTKGRRLTEKGLKKAYVYLKDGDTISLV